LSTKFLLANAFRAGALGSPPNSNWCTTSLAFDGEAITMAIMYKKPSRQALENLVLKQIRMGKISNNGPCH
jgi:hypothetical protein